jgi:hypothetical protein
MGSNEVLKWLVVEIKRDEVTMKRLLLSACLGFILFCLGFSACSKKEEAQQEKGRIEKMTDETADAIVARIRKPMDQARAVKDLEQDRAKAMEKALDEK